MQLLALIVSIPLARPLRPLVPRPRATRVSALYSAPPATRKSAPRVLSDAPADEPQNALPVYERGTDTKPPSEYELNLGRAMDVLREDSVAFAERELDWSIYTADVRLADPAHERTGCLRSYKRFFAAIRLFRNLAFDRVEVRHRLRYDWHHQVIIVPWYSEWYFKGSRQPMNVDAVSYYHLDEAGKISLHEVDRVEINGHRLNPESAWGKLSGLLDGGVVAFPSVTARLSMGDSKG